MAKKFDIHNWQAKHLFEQDDFTPDLEDDDLKRSKIQQMMAKEKESEYKLSDQEKDNLHDMVIEFARKLTDLRGGNYSGDKLLAALQHVTLEIENLEPMIYDDEDEDGIPDVVDNDEELDEQNVTGTGASFNAGDGEGYATPNAFAKKGKWKGKKAVYEQEEEESEEETQEPEEERTKDVEKIEKIVDSIVDTRADWIDLLDVVLDRSEDLVKKGLKPGEVKQLLLQAANNI